MAVTMSSPRRKPIHPVIRQLRKLRGKLSQAEFAQKLGISASTLRKWEQGVTLPDPTTLRFISMYLDSLEEK